MKDEYVAINTIYNPLLYGLTMVISIFLFSKRGCDYILSVPIYGCREEIIDIFFILNIVTELIGDNSDTDETEKQKLRVCLSKIFSSGRVMFNNKKYLVNELEHLKKVDWNSIPYTFCLE